jgi:2-polyprenyl-6-methoxyphenol hydroxylase-like FAD-dependent oxidoreductase
MYRGAVVADFDYRDTKQHRRLIEESFRGAGWRSAELLHRLGEVEDFYFDSVSRIRIGCWSKGRVTLLGDAASCVSFLGGGSSNAMAGAALLADALAATPEDPAAALSRYEREHRKRINPRQRSVGWGAHLLIPATAMGIAVRNAGMRVWAMGKRVRARGEGAR